MEIEYNVTIYLTFFLIDKNLKKVYNKIKRTKEKKGAGAKAQPNSRGVHRKRNTFGGGSRRHAGLSDDIYGGAGKQRKRTSKRSRKLSAET